MDWKIHAAYVYLCICIFDFILVPTFIGVVSVTWEEIFVIIKDMPLEVQLELVKSRVWEPLTLKGGGLFHLAFGALLTGSAVTEKIQKSNDKN